MKMINIIKNMEFRFIFRFKKNLEKKLIFWDVQIHLVNIKGKAFSVIFLGYFWFRASFSFSLAFTKKEMCAFRSFPQLNRSKMANQTGQNHCDQASKMQWVMSESKLFKELFVVVWIWTFFDAEGGGKPKSKLFEELFCLILDFF